MSQIVTEYIGDLRTKVKHLDSGIELITDAPKDNYGKGEYFSPTDLVATALGSCILTIMAIVAERRELKLNGTRAEITKVMSESPRKISELKVEIYFTVPFSIVERKIIEKAANSCPVHQSLSSEMTKNIIFNYPIKN